MLQAALTTCGSVIYGGAPLDSCASCLATHCCGMSLLTVQMCAVRGEIVATIGSADLMPPRESCRRGMCWALDRALHIDVGEAMTSISE